MSKGLASHEVRLRYCALEENDSDAQLFLARMNEADTCAAILPVSTIRISTIWR